MAACSSGGGARTAVSTSGPSTSATSSVTATERTVRGVVAGVTASARVISLVAAVQGFTDIAVTSDTEIRGVDGRLIALADIAPGATVEAAGRPGTATSLLARRVVILP